MGRSSQWATEREVSCRYRSLRGELVSVLGGPTVQVDVSDLTGCVSGSVTHSDEVATSCNCGRKPVDSGREANESPEAATSVSDPVHAGCLMARSDVAPFGASGFGVAVVCGLTPAATRFRPYGAGRLVVSRRMDGRSSSQVRAQGGFVGGRGLRARAASMGAF